MHLGLLDPLNGGEVIHALSPALCTLNPLSVIKLPESIAKARHNHKSVENTNLPIRGK